MARQYYDQVAFTQGELDPTVQKRIDWVNWYKSAKELRNGLVIPQGGFRDRFGTRFISFITSTTAEISTLVYQNQCTYLLLWEPLSLKIYLEDTLVATLVTQYEAVDIDNLRFTQVQTRIIINSGRFQPQQLVRNADTPVAITAFSGANNTLTATTGYSSGTILPARFTTGTSLPTTVPQIVLGRDYFIRLTSATTFKVYATAEDARADEDAFTISSAGTAANVVVQNTWAISNIPFKFYPAYDFDGGYFGSTFTFTPSATSGSVTITASSAIFTTAMVGGLYTGNGGIVRLTGFTSSTVMTGFTIEDFTNTNPIRGDQSFLGEPAWSSTRGWPRNGGFIQNRLVQVTTDSLPNGQWLSVTNDVYNFDDSEVLADSSIASYPQANNMSYIQSVTTGRSLIIHTTDGNYSTPVQSEIVLTPNNYVLILQNTFGVGVLQPVFIDNQVFFVDISGNNVINMVWEFAQSSYVTNSVSVKSSSLIRNPVDMSAFADPRFIDGFFVLFVNEDGTLCVLQTMKEEEISAFTLSDTYTYPVSDQNNQGEAIQSTFKRVVATQNRCWFIVERSTLVAGTLVAISNFTADTLTAVAHGMPIDEATRVRFTTTGNLPTTDPEINTTEYWFARGLTANTFAVYVSLEDAQNDENRVAISALGVNSNVVPYTVTLKLALEEVDFSQKIDCLKTQTFDPATTTITGLSHLEGQVVQIVADGFVIPEQVVVDGQITLSVEAEEVSVGLKYITKLTPLPPSLPQVPGALFKPRHVRNLYISYHDSVGFEIQGFGVPTQRVNEFAFGEPVVPATGTYEYTLMEGWDGVDGHSIEVTQPNPLPMTILALSYILEV